MAIKITNINLDQQIILCSGAIGLISDDPDLADNQISVDDFQKTFNCLNKDIPVTLYLDSYGGSLLDAQQMVNIMENYKKAGGVINVVVPYVAASCATLIALSGNTLTYHQNGVFLIHSVYYDPTYISKKYKLDEQTLTELKDDIANLNDYLANFYSKRSSTSLDEFRELLAKSEDILLSPEEMKSYGFNVEIVDLYSEDSPYKLNKTNKKEVNKNSINDQMRKVSTLGFVKDLKIKNLVLENTETEENTKINQKLTDSTNTEILNNMAEKSKDTEVEQNEETTGASPENTSKDKKPTAAPKAEFTTEDLRKIQEAAELKAKKEIAEKNLKVYNLFKNYLSDADYLSEYQACLDGMYTFEECNTRFQNLKTKKDQATFNRPQVKPTSINYADVNDVVYALCLKNGVNTKATEKSSRKLNYSDMSKEQSSLRDRPFSSILLDHINAKRLQNSLEPLELNKDASSFENANKILNNITQADLSNILTGFTTEVWLESDSYADLTNILTVMTWQKIVDMNKVQFYKNTTPISESQEIPENGEWPSMEISVKVKEFKPKKYGLKMSTTFETLLNDRFETFKNSFQLLLKGIQAGIEKQFVRELVSNRKDMEKITNVKSIGEALEAVQKFYNNCTDSKGKRINVKPKHLLTTSNIGSLFETFFQIPTDPTQVNPNKPNKWYGNKTYDLNIVIDPYLDTSLKEVNPVLYGTNKDDVYFIPENAIKYLSLDPQITPKIVTNSSNFDLDQEIGGLTIYGFAFIDPELIVCVDTSKFGEEVPTLDVKVLS